MGFWSRLNEGLDAAKAAVLGSPDGQPLPNLGGPYDTFDAAQRVLPSPYEPFIGTGGITIADPGVPLSHATGDPVAALWKAQPNVRKVVDFCARNIAGIPLHAFERVSDTDRPRVTDGPLAGVLSSPAPRMGSYRFWYAVLVDGLLYDRWAVLKVRDPRTGDLHLSRLPSRRTRFYVDALDRVRAIAVWDGTNWAEVDLDSLIYDHGYGSGEAGVSPLQTLSDILSESSEAVKYRREIWKNGARVPATLNRPAGAPEWGKDARARFIDGFRAAYTRNGSQAGGVPLLEDGMELKESTVFSPKDSQDLEGRRLTAIEVAAAYHIAPELVGAQQGNYSNVREFRQMLYRDSLGPYITAWEQAVQAQLVPELAEGRRLYVEANVESKLRGSFEEQATILSSAIGAPWMTRAEGRARGNLPEIDGADELVVPLNVLIGGQASPRDSGTQNEEPKDAPAPRVKSGTVSFKASAPPSVVEKAEQVLLTFFARQGRSVASAQGEWDDERWNRELADELAAVNVLAATTAGKATLEALGLDVDGYDEDATLAWLRKAAEGQAEAINETTRSQVAEALQDDEDGDAGKAVAALFAGVVLARGKQLAVTQVTAMSGFGSREAVQQTGVEASKTWRVRSANPRKSHKRMNGETVPLDEEFSNGSRWPGDSKLHPDERSGCTCEMEITREV